MKLLKKEIECLEKLFSHEMGIEESMYPPQLKGKICKNLIEKGKESATKKKSQSSKVKT